MNWNQLVNERNVWVAHNFPAEDGNPQESVWGVMEEMGELAHCHLKERQNIRGDAAKHQAGAKDAIGDLSVYLLGVLRYTGLRPMPIGFDIGETADRALSRLGHSVGLLALWDLSPDTFDPQGALNRIVSCCLAYCRARGWDYEAIVWETWNGVKQRDWIKYPDTGLPKYGHLSCDQCGGSGERLLRLEGERMIIACVNDHQFAVTRLYDE